MNKYRLLAIAPYEGFKGYFQHAISERDDVEADIYSASLREAADLVRTLDLSSYDAIICRGRSGRIVKEATDIPVINVDFSSFDLLRSLELARYSSHKKMAFVSFFNLGGNVQLLCELLNYKTKIITPDPPSAPEEMEALVSRLYYEEGVEIFVGDGACTHCANVLGVKNILVTSGPESMQKAIGEAVEICEYKYRLIRSNTFHKTIIEHSHLPMAVFDSQGGLVYSNLFSNQYKEDIHSRLRKYVTRVFHYQHMKCLVSNAVQSWKVHGESVCYQDQKYALFYIAESLPRGIQKTVGYRIMDSETAANSISIVTNNNSYKEIWNKARGAADSKIPLLVHGPSGMGKTTLAHAVYASSRLSRNPMIVIDCCVLDSRMFDRLFEDDRSPLFENSYTVLFKNVNALSVPLQNRMFHHITDLDLTERNRVISTFSGNIGKLMSSHLVSEELWHLLSGLAIQLPELHEIPEELPAIASSYINQLNQLLPIQLTGFESGALDLLKNHHWDSGIKQLKLVLKHIASSTKASLITKQNVEELLLQLTDSGVPQSSPGGMKLDLTKTLDDITKDIITLILEEENMNQTKTAKRLNISRSTLWKKLQA